MMRYTAGFLVGLVLLFVAQGVALRRAGGRPGKSESNFHSSVARIQDGMRGDPRVMLLGSSRTGRLPDRTQGFDGVANLGCDGASAAVTLRAMARGDLQPASVLWIEGNTLWKAALDPDMGLARAIRSPWFKLGCRAPLLSARARPSSFLYSFLLGRHRGAGGVPADVPVPRTRPALVGPDERSPLGTAEECLVKELAAVMSELDRRGVTMMIHDLPPAASPDSVNVRVSKEAARRTRVPRWDLTEALPPDSLNFTDGVHLDPASAAMVMMVLLDELPGPSGASDAFRSE